MTENEAIERLKDHFKIHNDDRPTPKLDEAVQMAIKALEKVTKERKETKLTDYWWNAFRGNFETEDDVFEFIFDRVNTSDFEDSYIDVGGHGDCNEYVKITASDKRETLYDFMMTILDEVQQYRTIGTVEECRTAMEKQTPKRPDYEGDGYADGQLVYDTWVCPCCGRRYEVDYDEYDYCPYCGQKLRLER